MARALIGIVLTLLVLFIVRGRRRPALQQLEDPKQIVDSFVRQHGRETLWDYLCAHPGRSLLDVANEMGGFPPAALLWAMVYRHCLTQRLMPEFVRDQISREFHRSLPRGWGASSAQERSQLFFVPSLREPYRSLIGHMQRIVCDEAPPPEAWSPSSPDDPVLVQAWEQAFAALPAESQQIVLKGEQTAHPGDVSRQAIEPFYSAVSIYDSPEVFSEQFAQVPEHIGHVLSAEWCESEVKSGGLAKLFSNAAGVLVPEAVRGFAAMGMPRCSELLAQAMKLLGEPYPRERAARLRALQALLDPRAASPFDALTSELRGSLADEAGGFEVAADAYINRATR